MAERPGAGTRLWRDASLRAALRLLAPGGGPAAGGAAAGPGGAPRRVLFLRPGNHGAQIMCPAVIGAIGHAPGVAALDVVASAANAPVLDGVGGVREVVTLARATEAGALRLGLALRGRAYDVVVDGLVLAARVSAPTALLMAACGAPARVGVGGRRGQAFVYTHPVDPPDAPGPHPAHHVDHLARLVLPFGGRPEDVGRPRLALSAAEEAGAERAWCDGAPPGAGARLLVNVSAGHPARRWGDAQFAEALCALRARRPDVRVGVVGEPGEAASARAVAAAAGGRAFATPGVRAALALVARADAVLTPDTAIAHAASAFGRPCVTLMLPGAEPFAPYRTPGRLVLSPEGRMAAVAAGRVTEALEAVLALAAGG